MMSTGVRTLISCFCVRISPNRVDSHHAFAHPLHNSAGAVRARPNSHDDGRNLSASLPISQPISRGRVSSEWWLAAVCPLVLLIVFGARTHSQTVYASVSRPRDNSPVSELSTELSTTTSGSAYGQNLESNGPGNC